VARQFFVKERTVIAKIIDFVDLLVCGLLVGAMFGAWLMLQPARLDATSYVLVQQNAIRALNDVMPALGGLTILVTLAAAFAAREDRARLIVLIVAAASLAAAGMITRFSNQRINAIVMTWAADAPPADWTLLRDQWWSWHVARLASGLIAFSLIIGAVLRRA
jgi:anthrone oxygenase-like protein